MQQFINSAGNTPERPVSATTDHLHIGQMTSALPSWLWGHVPNLIDVSPLSPTLGNTANLLW